MLSVDERPLPVAGQRDNIRDNIRDNNGGSYSKTSEPEVSQKRLLHAVAGILRLAARWRAKRTAVAVERSLRVMVYVLLTCERATYHDLGAQCVPAKSSFR
jgi:hypothetical protein